MSEIIFNKGDLVNWDYLESRINDFLRLYGKGPFYVFKVMPRSKNQNFRIKTCHSQVLIISRDKEGEDIVLMKKSEAAKEFSGEFFQKVLLENLDKLLIDNALEEVKEIKSTLEKVIEKSKVRVNPEQLWIVEESYYFCLGFIGKKRQFLEKKASLIDEAQRFFQEIQKILENFLKNKNSKEIKKIYNYVKRIMKK
jgi:hypothetical protein